MTPGARLRALREELGLTLRDVEAASQRIAARHENEEFVLAISRISEIETKGAVPSIYRLHALAAIYHRDLRELLSWYGVDVNETAPDMTFVQPARTHRVQTLAGITAVEIPTRLDPGFDLRRTNNLGRMIEQWGLVPLAYLAQLAKTPYSYAYIGSEDLTLYPLLMPGSLVQVDETKTEVAAGMWQSEYERPIYFVEMRDGYTCAWCALREEELVLQPHPLSPAPVRILRYPHDAEIVGQVVGVAMRLSERRATSPTPKGQATQS